MHQVALLVLVVVCATHAQIKVPGQCQDVTVEQDFDLHKYLGVWYEHRRYFTFYQLNGKCVSATYALNENGTIGVLNAQINSTTGEPDSIEGYAVSDSKSGEGKLLVYFPSTGSRGGKYWVLGTDYNNYAVVWGCSQAGPQLTIQTAWVLTRERTPSEKTLTDAQKIIDNNHLASEFIVTDQTNCS